MAKANFKEGPVGKLFGAALTAYENARGLNVGGAESGRRARAKAVARFAAGKTPRTMSEKASSSDKAPTAKGLAGRGDDFDVDKMIESDQSVKKIARQRSGRY